MTDKRAVYRAGIMSAVDVCARMGAGFVITVILARLLTPSDFGIIALTAVFLVVAHLVVEGGFSESLVREENLTHDDESTVFWFNLGVSSVMAVSVALSAAPIAYFFDEPVLAALIPVTALSIPIGALGSVPAALLTRRLQFARLAWIGTASVIMSGVVSISMAFAGFGVWSMVAQGIALISCRAFLLRTFSRWRPNHSFHVASLNKLWKFGFYMLLFQLVYITSTRAYALLIGDRFGMEDLGTFSQAVTLRDKVRETLGGSATRVLFPVLAAVSSDPIQMKQHLRKSLQIAAFVAFPACGSMVVMSEAIVVGLLGEKWIATAPILQVLSLNLGLWPLYMINHNGLKAQGTASTVVRIELLRNSILISFLIAALPFGLLAVAWSQVASSWVGLIIVSFYSRRLLDYGLLKQLNDITPYFFSTAIMIFLLILFLTWFDGPQLFALLLGCLVGMGSYFAASMLLGDNILQEAISSIRTPSR